MISFLLKSSLFCSTAQILTPRLIAFFWAHNILYFIMKRYKLCSKQEYFFFLSIHKLFKFIWSKKACKDLILFYVFQCCRNFSIIKTSIHSKACFYNDVLIVFDCIHLSLLFFSVFFSHSKAYIMNLCTWTEFFESLTRKKTFIHRLVQQNTHFHFNFPYT